MRSCESGGLAVSNKRIIIVVSESRADWNLFAKGRFIKQATQQLSYSNEKLTVDVQLPADNADWNTDKDRVFVEVIINSHLDDIDRVKLKKPDFKKQAWLSTFFLLRHLRLEYPDSSVWKLPPQYHPEVASLLHSVVSPAIRHWLSHIQKQGLLISHILTVPQLLVHSCARESQPVLYCSDLDGNAQRHILIDNEAPIFLRCINTSFENSKKQIEETRAYLTSFIDVNKYPLKIVSLVDGGEHTQPKSQSMWLSSLLVGCPGLENYQNNDNLVCSEKPSDDLVKHEKCKVERLLPGRYFAGLNARQKTSSLNQRAESRLTVFAGQRTSVSQYKILKYPIGKLSELQPSIDAQKQIRISRYSGVFFRMLVFLAILALFFSVFSFLKTFREQNELRNEQAHLSQRIHSVGNAVAGLHSKPDLALRSLERRLWHSTIVLTTPESVLKNVASTIVDFPHVSLDTLLWVVSEDDHKTSEQVLNVQRSATRVIDESKKNIGQKVTINIKGRITLDAYNLREAQKYLEKYIHHLEEDSRITNVFVLESPVDSVQVRKDQMQKQNAFEITLSLFYS